MWKAVSNPKSVKVTRELAKEFAAMQAPPHDRLLNVSRMKTYELAIAGGTFRPVTWSRCFCKETNEMYRVNGKHTSTVLSEIDPFPSLYVTIEDYEADTLEDVARLYGTFDSKTQSRSSSDVNRCFAQSNADLCSVPAKVINLAVTGMSFAKWGNGYGDIQAVKRAELMLDDPAFVLWVDSLVSQHDSKVLARGPVVAAMYVTYVKNKKDATEFWTAVRDATGESPGLPCRTLNRWLLTMSVAVGNGAHKPSSRKASQREFFVKSIHGWNAYRRKTTTDLKYLPAAKLPAVV